MKRYIHLAISAISVLLVTSCDLLDNVEVSVFHFGESEVEVAAKSATIITDIPYITISGVRQADPAFYLQYMVADDGTTSEVKTVTHYDVEGDKAIFKIDGLEPETTYKANIIADGGTMGIMTGFDIMFTTEEYLPVYSFTCNCDVVAKGLTASVSLTDVAYLIDDMPTAIRMVTFEYANIAADSGKRWSKIEIDGGDFEDGTESISLPENGGDFLEENASYTYRITIQPADTMLEAFTTEEATFKTTFAEVTAEISKPKLSQQEDKVVVTVDKVVVYYDGEYLPAYFFCDYYIMSRKVGEESWSKMYSATLQGSGMTATIDVATLEEGTYYEFCGAVIAGKAQTEITSEVETFGIPKQDDPTPEPPKPPIGGSSDTTAIAGEWHLTQWRGAEPSFDVYMSITEDGVVSLWQRIESRAWELYYSTVTYEDDTIWGEYTDGVAWGASYYVAIDGDSMTWTDTVDATDVSIYTRAKLPADITATTSELTRGGSARFL